jgi:outer membrane protein insertion porin family
VGSQESRRAGSRPGLRVRVRALCLLAAALTVFPCAGRAAKPGEAPVISSIRFEGNEHLSRRQLLGAMRLRPPSWWKPFVHPRYPGSDFLATDLRAILLRYQEVGFPLARIEEAVVTYNERGDTVDLLIHVDEGRPVQIGRVLIRGLPEGWRQELEAGMPFHRAAPLSWPLILEQRDRINAFCSDRGHPLTRTSLVARYAADSAEVVYTCNPGERIRVGKIRVEGLQHSREKMVLRELVVKPGDVLRGPLILKSQERLLGSGVFRRARLLPTFPDSNQAVADLTVSLEERKHAWYSLGAGYSSGDQVRLASDWGLYNLTGMGRRLSATGSLYYSLDKIKGLLFHEGLAQVEYIEPWLLGTRTRGIVTPYLHWLHEEPTTSYHRPLNERTIGYTLTLQKDLARKSRASLGLETKYVATSDSTAPPKYTTRLLNLNYTDDRRDNIFDPSRGSLSQLSAEYAGGPLKGSYRFARFTGSWQAYKSPWKKWVLAYRIKLGQITAVGRSPVSGGAADTLLLSRIPWEERFRIGGGSSVRGYREGLIGRLDNRGLPIGGMTLLLSNVELRFPLFWIVQLGAFLDMGNVWADPAELSFTRFTHGFYKRTYDPKNVAYGAGGGIRFMTPVGPFRIDYGFKLGSTRAPGEGAGEFHVALGQAF